MGGKPDQSYWPWEGLSKKVTFPLRSEEYEMKFLRREVRGDLQGREDILGDLGMRQFEERVEILYGSKREKPI